MVTPISIEDLWKRAPETLSEKMKRMQDAIECQSSTPEPGSSQSLPLVENVQNITGFGVE